MAVTHPARFSVQILDRLAEVCAARLDGDARVLDPFAGVGGVHRLPFRTVGVEIEGEWAAGHPGTVCGDARMLPFPDGVFDAIVTSPAYGNRMADGYAGDGTRRFTYRVALGRALSEGNGGGLHWGDGYRRLHERVWGECRRVLRDGGWLVVNVSNHVRGGVEQPVVEWHLGVLLRLGFRVDEVVRVATRRMRFGAHGGRRVDGERILVMRLGCGDEQDHGPTGQEVNLA